LELGERVRFANADRSELQTLYAAADVFVFPSEWDEPFGLVPVEAMACGTPVVATCTGGSAEFLRDGVNCLRFRARDPSELARCVRSLAADASLRARLVSGGLATAAELDTDRLAEVFEAWHVAAAGRFADGVPPDRALDIPASVDSGA
jgi:glycosyltransferase involved in cell wall biosynthesis